MSFKENAEEFGADQGSGEWMVLAKKSEGKLLCGESEEATKFSRIQTACA